MAGVAGAQPAAVTLDAGHAIELRALHQVQRHGQRVCRRHDREVEPVDAPQRIRHLHVGPHRLARAGARHRIAQPLTRALKRRCVLDRGPPREVPETADRVASTRSEKSCRRRVDLQHLAIECQQCNGFERVLEDGAEAALAGQQRGFRRLGRADVTQVRREHALAHQVRGRGAGREAPHVSLVTVAMAEWQQASQRLAEQGRRRIAEQPFHRGIGMGDLELRVQHQHAVFHQLRHPHGESQVVPGTGPPREVQVTPLQRLGLLAPARQPRHHVHAPAFLGRHQQGHVRAERFIVHIAGKRTRRRIEVGDGAVRRHHHHRLGEHFDEHLPVHAHALPRLATRVAAAAIIATALSTTRLRH